MDPFSSKLPKSNSSGGTGGSIKSSINIPLAIRFNANEESIEDVSVKSPSASFSCSPQQNSDDFSWKKDFLQGTFFQRKRSGSIEGGTSGIGGSSPSNQVSNSTTTGSSSKIGMNTSTGGGGSSSSTTSNDANTVGTWKLIKGKVSQAMEDIKSTKNTFQGDTKLTLSTASIASSSKSGGGNKSDKDIQISDSVSGSMVLLSNTGDPESDLEIVNTSSSSCPINEDMIFIEGTFTEKLNKSNSSLTGYKSDSDSDIDEDEIFSTALSPSTTTAIGNLDGGEIFNQFQINPKSRKIPFSNFLSKTSSGASSPPTATTAGLGLATTAGGGGKQALSSNIFQKSENSRISSYGNPLTRTSFLRKRKKLPSSSNQDQEQQQQQKQNDGKITKGGEQSAATIQKYKTKEMEIESGIEMLEEMILPTLANNNNNSSSNNTAGTNFDRIRSRVGNENSDIMNSDYFEIINDDDGKSDKLYYSDELNEIGVNISGESIGFRKVLSSPSALTSSASGGKTHLSTNTAGAVGKSTTGTESTTILNSYQKNYKIENKLNIHELILMRRLKIVFINLYNNFSIVTGLMIILFVLLLLPLPDFFRGVIACLFTISLFTYLYEFIKNFIESKCAMLGPERCEFKIPNYNTLPILEIPIIEEHKPLKSYSGWMNEINNYDPLNSHISMTKSVFIRLDGSILRISNVANRIPKRSMWNEQLIDRKNILFTRTRMYNVLNCRVEMCPKGLARKRYFSRKYPIQLTIRNTEGLSYKQEQQQYEYDDNLMKQNQQQQQQQLNAGTLNRNENRSLIINGNHDSNNLSSSPVTYIIGSSSNNNNNNNNNNYSNMNTMGIDSSSSNNNNNNNNAPINNTNDDDNFSDGNGNSNEANLMENSKKSNLPDDLVAAKSLELDFGNAILNSDFQKLQDVATAANQLSSSLLIASSSSTSSTTMKDSSYVHVPCGDETRILVFARCDREKEDWYRRFYQASIGDINDSEIHPIPSDAAAGNNVNDSSSDFIKVNESEISASLLEDSSTSNTGGGGEEGGAGAGGTGSSQKNESQQSSERNNSSLSASIFEGLLISPCAGRTPQEYVKFMSIYQKACTQSKIPVIKSSLLSSSSDTPKRDRRQKRQEDDLWKGIDQSLFIGPATNVIWANVLIGRFLFGCLNDMILLEKIQEFLQRKLSAIKLPSFMEDVVIAQVHLGDTPPLIHRVSQPLLDERGTWLDADVTYEGLMHMTITTRLNLLRLKKQQQQQQQNQQGGNYSGGTNLDDSSGGGTSLGVNFSSGFTNIENANPVNTAGSSSTNEEGGNPQSSPVMHSANCAIYDSNAESSGASSSESESPTLGSFDAISSSDHQQPAFYTAPGSSRRLLRIVDRITASNFFQSATEISYIQRAMENMSTKITLRVELKGLVSRVVINLPPPPSDRVWLSFRGPPRLWISAKPAVGDHAFDWSIVTNIIENKLCEEVYKYLVYPNMVDVIVPFLGQSTYKE